jgi:hypothetical protein
VGGGARVGQAAVQRVEPMCSIGALTPSILLFHPHPTPCPTPPPRDIDMVKFLVQAGADIRARAWGTFFAPGGRMY